MAVNKVVFGGETLMDLTSDTVSAESLAEGETAHAANGEPITGTLTAVQYGKAQSLSEAQKAQARQNIGSVSTDEVGSTVENALSEAKESGEFDGPKGDPGSSGVYLGTEEPTDPTVNVWIDPEGMPSRLLPLFSDEDISELVSAVVAALPVYAGEVADA